MLNFFPDGSLPGGEVGPFKETDVASFEEIFWAAGKVEQECVVKDHAVGFGAVGLNEAIGVFLWATDSLENVYLEGSALNGTAPPPSRGPSIAANTSALVNGRPPNAELSNTS